MKFFTIEFSREDKLKGVLLRTPWFTFAIYPTPQSPEETVADKPYPTPLWETADGIRNRTDPLLMDTQQRHENTVRMWMERKGYKRKEVDAPLTDERMMKIGRMPWPSYKAWIDAMQAYYRKEYESDPAGAVEMGQSISIGKKQEQADGSAAQE